MYVFRISIVMLAVAVGVTPCLAQTNSKEVMAKESAELIKILESEQASLFDKAKACQRLAVVGDKDAVPALVRLLPDETLNLYARFGLEGIRDPAAAQALRTAASNLQGRPLAGVLGSLGQIRDEESVAILSEMLNHEDSLIANSAAAALGKIGSSKAAEALQATMAKNSRAQTAIADACIVCADALAAAGKNDEAIALLDALSQGNLPPHLQIAALKGRFAILGDDGHDLLIEQLSSTDDARFNLGLAVLRDMSGEGLAKKLADRLTDLSPPRQALLLLALGDRPEGPLPEMLAAASTSDAPELREAAIRVLAKRGDASAAPILLDAALSDGSFAASAQQGLQTLQGKAVDDAIVARLADANPQAKVVLFELAGVRRIAAATPLVRQALNDSNAEVKAAALNAFAQLADVNDMDMLLERASASDAAEAAASRQALRTAVMRLGDQEASTRKLAERLANATPEYRTYLLELLGQMGGSAALKTVVASANSSDAATKDAATRVLGDWPNADAASALLAIAKNDREAKFQIRALRGYLRIARQLQLPAEERLVMFLTAMDVARRDEEKQLAMDVLTRIPSSETLRVAVSFLDDPTVKTAAADAAVKIAPKVLASDAKTVAAAMQKVVGSDVGAEIVDRAKQLLGQAQSSGQ